MVAKAGRVLGGLLLAAALAACQAPTRAPVSELGQPPSNKILTHIVSRGETLYAIAWRYELDFQQLAAANGIASPYPLQPGQRLTLDVTRPSPAGATVASAPGSYGASAPPPGRVRTAPVDSAPGIVVSPSPDTSWQGSTAPPAPAPQAAIPEPSPALPAPGPQQPAPPAAGATAPEPPLPAGNWSWQWPARGQVSREYDADNVFKGISIATPAGTQVAAAAPGTVVYSGEGLRGYGKLIIVKHSDKYLSAYAHNKALLVRENDTVTQGQNIAVAGTDASNRNRLYFEIRENGKPVDPLKLLPQ